MKCSRCVSVLLTVVFASKNLRRNVVGCSTEGARGVTRSDSLLRKEKRSRRRRMKGEGKDEEEEGEREYRKMRKGTRKEGQREVHIIEQWFQR